MVMVADKHLRRIQDDILQWLPVDLPQRRTLPSGQTELGYRLSTVSLNSKANWNTNVVLIYPADRQ